MRNEKTVKQPISCQVRTRPGWFRGGLRPALAAIVLAGCQGGGDATAPSGTTPPPAVVTHPSYLSAYFVESFDAYAALAQQLIGLTPKYLQQDNSWIFRSSPEIIYSTYPLDSSNVEFAHAAGLTGAGSSIAFADAGFLTTHEAIAGHSITTASNLAVDSHGTSVVSAAAGNSASMIGVAPNADLILGQYDSPQTLAEITQLATTNAAVALNNSWGLSSDAGGTLFATQANFTDSFSRGPYAAYLSSLRVYTQNGVAVFAASNTATDGNTSLMAGLPLFDSTLEAGWLAVINGVATTSSDQIQSAVRLSSACLESARWCLAAEGTWDAATATSTNSYALAAGTSFSTPMVSGALALLQEAFPTLTAHQLRTRLLASADQGFVNFNASGTTELAPGFARSYSDEWGLGFLDIKAALLPIGPTGITLQGGAVQSLSSPLVVSGLASGDAIARSLPDATVIINDVLSGDFNIPLTSLVGPSASQSAVDRLTQAYLTAGGMDLLADYGTPLRLSLGRKLQMALLAPASGPQGRTWGLSVKADLDHLSLQAAVMQDAGVLMPSTSASPNTRVAALGMTLKAQPSETTAINLSVRYGSALGKAPPQGGFRDLAFNSLSLTGSRRGLFQPDDSLSLSLSLPIALSSGTTSLALPTARSASGGLVYSQMPIDLSPRDREVDAALIYRRSGAHGGAFYLGALHAENLGNVAGRRDSGIVFGLSTVF